LPADEEWLDHEANMVDEQCILDELEAASDYERGLKRLGEACYDSSADTPRSKLDSFLFV
jgi:hypothetical protein